MAPGSLDLANELSDRASSSSYLRRLGVFDTTMVVIGWSKTASIWG
jgi:hypothetical protein